MDDRIRFGGSLTTEVGIGQKACDSVTTWISNKFSLDKVLQQTLGLAMAREEVSPLKILGCIGSLGAVSPQTLGLAEL